MSHAHLGICARRIRRLGGGEDQAVAAVHEIRDVISEDCFDAVRQLLFLADDPASDRL